jgi:hypothetical protein
MSDAAARRQRKNTSLQQGVQQNMIFATGCVSAAASREGIQIDRLIEYFSPRRDACTLWIDLFITNESEQPGTLRLLHRGSLTATDVTNTSWPTHANGATEHPDLTSLITQLHENDQAITTTTETVKVGDVDYAINSRGPGTLRTLIGGTPKNVPFTIWEIGDVSRGRSVVRVELKMTPQTFTTQIGGGTTFFAYGEAILLDVISKQDLPCYQGADRDEFIKQFDEFTKQHQTPDVFEYIITSNDPQIRWTTTPISPNLSERYIPKPLRGRASWFLIEWPHADKFHVQGNVEHAADELGRQNMFALRLQAVAL